ncbi:MAG: DUF4350 domain-containing protein [Luteimonas sp.]
MKRLSRNLMLSALAVIAIALFVAWWTHRFERVERTVDLPPRGEASYNPLYALKLALLADGVQAQSRQRLQWDQVALGAHDTVLILNDPRTLSQGDVDGLLQWVQRGGHLLVRTPPRERGKSVRVGALLEALKLRPLPRSSCLWLAPGAAPGSRENDRKTRAQAVFCQGARFTLLGVEPLQSWGDLGNGYVHARLAHGMGTIDVLADFDFIGNAQLQQPASRALARQLLQPGWRAGSVHLVYAASMPALWRLVLDNAWMAWLPWLLGLCAWLWMRMQRFGPRLPSPEPARRALLEHVQASGEHLWRYGRAASLYMAVREVFMARLRRRDPLAAVLDGAAQASAIAQRTGVGVAEVARALQTPRPGDGKDFVSRIATLLQLRQRL